MRASDFPIVVVVLRECPCEAKFLLCYDRLGQELSVKGTACSSCLSSAKRVLGVGLCISLQVISSAGKWWSLSMWCAIMSNPTWKAAMACSIGELIAVRNGRVQVDNDRPCRRSFATTCGEVSWGALVSCREYIRRYCLESWFQALYRRELEKGSSNPVTHLKRMCGNWSAKPNGPVAGQGHANPTRSNGDEAERGGDSRGAVVLVKRTGHAKMG